jgi:hypothetical protein
MLWGILRLCVLWVVRILLLISSYAFLALPTQPESSCISETQDGVLHRSLSGSNRGTSTSSCIITGYGNYSVTGITLNDIF